MENIRKKNTTASITNSNSFKNNTKYILKLNKLSTDTIDKDYIIINNYFKTNRQKIYTKITEFNLTPDPPIFYDIKLNKKQEIDTEHAKNNNQLTNDIISGGTYVYALNAYKSIMVDEKKDIDRIALENINNSDIVKATSDHKVGEYVDMILVDIFRMIICNYYDDSFYMFKNAVNGENLLHYYYKNYNMFLIHYGNFLSKIFRNSIQYSN